MIPKTLKTISPPANSSYQVPPASGSGSSTTQSGSSGKQTQSGVAGILTDIVDKLAADFRSVKDRIELLISLLK